MPAKIVTIKLDPATCEFSVDNTGFQGKGCSEITQAFAQGNKVLKDIKKPEYKLKTVTTVCK